MSLRGWLLMVCVILAAGSAVFFNAYSFLAVTDRANADTLVVEGWVHEYAINAAIQEFRSGSYRHLFTTGGPVTGKGGYINDYNTSASVGADLLVKAGMQRASVQMVPSRVIGRDRTYYSAVALREWFFEHHVHPTGINVITEDAHARRTRLLFQNALGSSITVGVIAVPDPDYDAKHWWRYSDGVREIIGEGIAYVYAELFFHLH